MEQSRQKNKSQIVRTFQNIGYALFANLLNIVVSAMLTILVPKIFPEEQYGYWQLYIFYTSYIGLFHFGLQDGIYLRYGGAEYGNLDKRMMHSQLSFLMGMEVVVAGGILLFALVNETESNRQFVLIALAIATLVYLPNTHLQYVLQATNRIKHFSHVLILEKLIYGVTAIMILLLGVRDFKPLIWADLVAKLFGLLYICWHCRDIVLSKGVSICETLSEARKNMSAGILLLTSNLAAQFSLGAIRMMIEQDITMFAKVSLSFSLCNFVLVFVTAVGQVVFPALRQVEKTNFTSVFTTANQVMTFPLLAVYLLYFPARFVLERWIPHYVDAFFYFMLLLPMCVFESKNTIIMSTFFKAFRMEKALLLLNFVFLVFNCISAALMIFYLNDLVFAIILLTVMTGLKRFTAEVVLARKMKCGISASFFWEIILSATFLYLASMIDMGAAFIGYLAAYCVFLFLNRNSLNFKKPFLNMKDF